MTRAQNTWTNHLIVSWANVTKRLERLTSQSQSQSCILRPAVISGV